MAQKPIREHTAKRLLDQRRLDAPLYRHPWDDIVYDLPRRV